MTQHQRFHLKSLAQLRAELDSMSLDLPVTEDIGCLGDEVQVGAHKLWNRLTVQPMEGFDADAGGSPGPLAFRRYCRYAAGGSSLIWFEATAVVAEGRSNPGQFYINDDNVDVFARLVAETRQTARDSVGREPVLILQLTHSGRYSKPFGTPAPLIAHHSPVLDPIHKLGPDYPLITDDALDRLQDQFVHAAKLALRAGFDGIDVKCCHRYLLSELLGSFTRDGKYGGSYENRTRMLRETLGRIRQAVPEIFVTTRLNAFDAISYPYGFGVDKDDCRKPDLTEPLRLVGDLCTVGMPLINISIGNPYFNPHYGRPYDWPIKGFSAPDDHPLAGIARFVGVTRRIQESYPHLPVIGSGYGWLRQFMPNVAAAVVNSGGATLIGQGRGAFAYPESVRDILEHGAMTPAKCCVTCSACTQIMRDGGQTGCVVHDSEVYGPQYRLARRFSLDRLRLEAQRCRDCEEAKCSCGCPAQIDVPAFIRSFANDDIAGAYAVLREKNILPEMCGSVCPASEQCQGHCLENIFSENPIPIQDIQLVVSRLARLQGLTGVKLPVAASGRQVAVVGGGPSGIACAVRLLEAGHLVTIYEKGGKLGGVPDSTIPGARYGDAAAEVTAILAPARAAGRLQVQFETALGAELDLEQLRRRSDAIFLAPGLTGAASLGQARGVVGALAFLARAKRGEIVEIPPRVAVLGGGNTAMDAAATAQRLGALDVYLVYRRSFAEMPAWSAERDECLKQGVHFLLLTQPLAYQTDGGGNLTGLTIARTELGAPGADGRRRPRTIEGSESILPVTMVIEALGQNISDDIRAALNGVRLTRSGLIDTGVNSHATSVAGVYAGGDIINGGATAVQGIHDGMLAAQEICEYLKSCER